MYTAAFYSSSIPPPPFHSSPRVTIHQLFPSSSRQNSPREHPLAPSIPLRHLLLPHHRPSFPSDAVTGVAPAPNSYKIDGQEPHRQRGWRVTPSGYNFSPSSAQLPRSSARSKRPLPSLPRSGQALRYIYATVPVCAYTLHHTGARVVCVRRRGSSTSVAEVGNGAKAKRRASRSYDREGGTGGRGRKEREKRGNRAERRKGMDEDVKLNADE